MKRLLPLPLLLLACQSVKVPAPEGPELGFVGIQVRVLTFETNETRYPDRIWFVRLEEGKDPGHAGPVLASNYARGQSVYLLNAEPGRYVVVAAGERRDGKMHFTYFPLDCIQQSAVQVEAGKGAFMGLLSVRSRQGIEPGEKVMLHYSGLVNPAIPGETVATSLFPRTRTNRATECRIDRSPERVANFWENASDHLARDGWSSRLLR